MAIVVNAFEAGSAYIIAKGSNQLSSHLTFSTPPELQAADRVNFRMVVQHMLL